MNVGGEVDDNSHMEDWEGILAEPFECAFLSAFILKTLV